MTSLKTAVIALITVVAVVSAIHPMHAQSSPRLIVQIYQPTDGFNSSQLLSLGSDGAPVKLRDLAHGQTVAINSGINTLAVMSFDDTTRKTKIQVGPLDDSQALTTVVETSDEIVHLQFIGKGGQFLTYTILPAPGSVQSDKWTITLFDVTTKNKIELAETFVGTKFRIQGGLGAVASALWFDKDRKRLYVVSFQPYGDAIDDAELYTLDLSRISFEKALNVTNLPSAHLLTDGIKLSGGIQVSPEGSKVAYLSYDSQNPPRNYNFNNPPGERIPLTYNIITLYSLAAQKKTVVTVGKGQAIEKMTWTSDGKQLLFTGGNFNDTYFITTPWLYSVNAANGNITDKGVLESSHNTSVSFLTACGEQLYFVKTQNDQSSLYAADLEDITQVKGPLLSTVPNVIGCVA